jgi:hypothetical protein
VKRLFMALVLAGSVAAPGASVAIAASPDPSASPNHGDQVSAVAKAWDHVNGQAHGKAVSAIASAHGKAVSAAAKAKSHGHAQTSPGPHGSGDIETEPGLLKANS